MLIHRGIQWYWYCSRFFQRINFEIVFVCLFVIDPLKFSPILLAITHETVAAVVLLMLPLLFDCYRFVLICKNFCDSIIRTVHIYLLYFYNKDTKNASLRRLIHRVAEQRI